MNVRRADAPPPLHLHLARAKRVAAAPRRRRIGVFDKYWFLFEEERECVAEYRRTWVARSNTCRWRLCVCGFSSLFLVQCRPIQIECQVLAVRRGAGRG